MGRTASAATAGARGWVLTEMLVCLVLVLFFTTTLVETAVSMQRCLLAWDRGLRMRQVLAGALFCLTRDLRLAGCNPLGGDTSSGLELEGEGEGGRLTIRLDRRGAQPGSWPDGDMEDPDEEVTYHCDPESGVLRRNGQPMALGLRPDPDGRPLFSVRHTGNSRLLETSITLGEGEETTGLSARVQVRNPF